MTYLYREVGPEHELRTWDANRLMRWCARDLYIPEQPIRWHAAPVKAEPGELWTEVVGTARFTPNLSDWSGWVDWSAPGIAVVAGQPEPEMLRTVAHEMYHRYEAKEGREADHTRAEAYARRVTDDYLARRIP